MSGGQSAHSFLPSTGDLPFTKDGILKQVIIDPRIKENNVVENHLIVRPGDEVHTFIGANSTLGVLVMRFDSLEQMLGMIENADEWIGIEYP